MLSFDQLSLNFTNQKVIPIVQAYPVDRSCVWLKQWGKAGRQQRHRAAVHLARTALFPNQAYGQPQPCHHATRKNHTRKHAPKIRTYTGLASVRAILRQASSVEVRLLLPTILLGLLFAYPSSESVPANPSHSRIAYPSCVRYNFYFFESGSRRLGVGRRSRTGLRKARGEQQPEQDCITPLLDITRVRQNPFSH